MPELGEQSHLCHEIFPLLGCLVEAGAKESLRSLVPHFTFIHRTLQQVDGLASRGVVEHERE